MGVVSISDKFNGYAQWVERQLTIFGYYAECEKSSKTLNKKVRESQLAQWNYICVVGEQEQNDLSVNVRSRDVERPLGTFSVADFMAKLQGEGMPTSQPLCQFEPFEGRMPSGGAAAAPTGDAKPASPKAKAARPKLNKQGSLLDRKICADVEDDIEAFLEQHAYIKGFQPSAADREHYDVLLHHGAPTTPNLRRWFDHMESFTELERKS